MDHGAARQDLLGKPLLRDRYEPSNLNWPEGGSGLLARGIFIMTLNKGSHQNK